MIRKFYKNNFTTVIYLTIFLLFVLRLMAMFLIGDENLTDEWKSIIQNLSGENPAGKEMFATRIVDGEPVPNFFMPPAYPFYIYFMKVIFGAKFLPKIVIVSQIIISIISIIYLYKILAKFFPKKICFFSSFIFAILPINIFASIIISSASFQLSLLIFYFYALLVFIEKKSFFNILNFSILTSILILLRGEFFAFHFLTIIFLFFKKVKLKKISMSILISLILVSPYLTRNYLTFGSISIAKAEGYDLWKGNNPYAGVEGNENIDLEKNYNLKDKIESLPPSKDYDFKIDKLYKQQAIEFIKLDPTRYLVLYFKKFLTFAFINFESNYPGYFNLLHIIPKIILSFGTIIGFFYLKKKDEFLIFSFLYYLATLSIFSFFFILPRYSLSVLPIQFFMISFLLTKMNIKIFKNSNNEIK